MSVLQQSELCVFLVVFQEHHLQRAISAQQVFREKKENMVIPVPEAESNTTYYDRLYKGEVKAPKQLIHIQREYSLILVYICSSSAVSEATVPNLLLYKSNLSQQLFVNT